MPPTAMRICIAPASATFAGAGAVVGAATGTVTLALPLSSEVISLLAVRLGISRLLKYSEDASRRIGVACLERAIVNEELNNCPARQLSCRCRKKMSDRRQGK